ncbi:beta clamp domain-containing protein [Mycobacterium dioxanotrophicus]|nr:hypothetical protein [Mycobacterium dioxanotrophicus]
MTTELVRILKEASLFASSATTIPIINAVHLEASGQELVAVGTDRFVLGASKTELDEATGGFAAALTLQQVKTIIQLAGACKQAFSKVALDADGKTIRVAFSSGETITLPASEIESGVHRGWLTLLKSSPDSEPSKAMVLNPQFLAKFARVSGASRMRVHFFGHTRPIRVVIGDSFVGMVMPVRMADDDSMDWVVPEWVNPSPEKREPKKAVARKPRAKRPSKAAVA